MEPTTRYTLVRGLLATGLVIAGVLSTLGSAHSPGGDLIIPRPTGTPIGPVPPPPPAAMIAMNGLGDGMAVWNSDTAVMAQRYVARQDWEDPVMIHSGSEDIETVHVAMAGSVAYALWEEDDNIQALRYDETAGWATTPEQLDTGLAPSSQPLVTMNNRGSSGTSWAVWREVVQLDPLTQFAGAFVDRNLPGGGWQSRTRLDPGNDLTTENVFSLNAAMDGIGRATAVWVRTDFEGSDIVQAVFARRWNGMMWGEETRLAFGDDLSGSRVAADVAGNAIAVWAQDGRVVARHYDIDTGIWRLPRELNPQRGGGASSPDVAMDRDGNAVAVWTDRNLTAVYVSRYTADLDAWSPDLRIDNTMDGMQVGGRSPRVGMDDERNIRIVWLGGGNRVYTVAYNAQQLLWSFAQETGTGGANTRPQVAMDASGIAIGAWGAGETRVWIPGAPTADFTIVSQTPALTGETVEFDASASVDDGTITAYEWDFQDDGTYDSNAGELAMFTYATADTYTVRLRVTDDTARTDETTRDIVVFEPGGEGTSLLTVSPTGDGTGTVRTVSDDTGIACGPDCEEYFPVGRLVLLVAIPDEGSVFSGWSTDADQCSGGAGPGAEGELCSVTITPDDRTLIAEFQPDESDGEFTLTFEVFGEGEVATGDGGLICPTDCTESYPAGTTVTIFATTPPGGFFGGWGGDCVEFGTMTGFNLVMDSDKNCTAGFE